MKQTIKEVKKQLKEITDKKDPFIIACQNDPRKGVQTALKQWNSKQQQKEQLKTKFETMNIYEEQAKNQNFQFVAGIDEVGRGPLAGPVVAAAVILDNNRKILGLDDSKKLTEKKRNELFKKINKHAISIGIGIVDVEEIDHLNILEATKLAMIKAVQDLKVDADFLLVDAVSLNIEIQQLKLYQGDQKSNSIAAASIVAKTIRDELMIAYDKNYPDYGFSTNVGYGTKEHLESLQTLGPTPIHRKSFAPVKKYL